MMSLRFLLVVTLALSMTTTGTHGFMPTKKKSAERRAAFPNNGEAEEQGQTAASTQTSHYQQVPSPTAAFAIPPNAMVHAAAVYEYEEDEEEDVSYEVALISCVISLAIGFGTGYLV